MRRDAMVRIRARRRLALVALLLAAAACVRREDVATVDRWLRCEECTGGELQRVRALGVKAVPVLARALDGPPAWMDSAMRQQFSGSWTRARAQSLTYPPTMVPSDSAVYVDRVLANFRATYQKRAIVGLQAIGGAKARDALRTAIARDSLQGRRPMRADVRRVADSLVALIP